MHPLEQKKIREVTREYQDAGYTVLTAPTAKELPAFLQRYQGKIDLLATRVGDARVIEVATTQSLMQSPYLKDLAVALKNEAGWKLDLVITNPKRSKYREDADFEDLTVSELQERIAQVKELMKANFYEAALIMCWSAFESSARTLLQLEQPNLRNRSTSAVLLKQLFAYGIIDREEYNWLRSVTKFRSYLAHGFDHKSVTVERSDVQKLLGLVQQFMGTVQQYRKN